ncbi:hypothetical protein FEM48_Zijuj03G0065700 [Ziziphus jujuba var. spinosa]|uniref:Disease resistance protein At4g27190-like leucine-rich repeats domain-containing protein n=1 Tax=Ziziphus jujuba var. spinosa TaxID=714518 RepID=A0A978VNR4_ZIZJJ|nr:hypothetical protein FEM48_Zijuj03G0065700 [Ziziphus jujuba var. spinosa]
MNKSKIIANNADVFGNLEEVEVRNCNNLMKIFTSSMQRSLRSLRRLDISSCEMVEEVFEIQTSSVEEITQDTVPSQLISLSLSRLRKLEYVWGKDPRGTLTFTHLEDVAVFDCPSLKSIFPLSIAKGLLKLRNLHLSHCGIQQIVEAVGTNAPVPPEFVFPQLQEMNLTHLENLVCFYPGLHTSSWPSLTSLIVEKCDKVKVLASELSSFQENHVLHYHDSSPIQQPLIFTKRRLHNIKRLEISHCEMVEEVFEIQMPKVEGTYNIIPSESELIHLSLESLLKLKHVKWYKWYLKPNVE